MEILIIGGGVAAVEAGIAARLHNPSAQITILSNEEVLPYRRPALSRMLFENLSDVQFFIKPKTFYHEKKIQLKLKTQVDSISPERNIVTCCSGEKFHYDKLLLAIGAEAFIPPVKRPKDIPLRVLRNFADLQSIKSLKAADAIILGGGLLGLELADGLIKRGFTASIIEMCDRLLPKQLDEAGSRILNLKLAEVEKLNIFTNECVEEITATGVKLKSGSFVPGSVFFAASGARACSCLARGAKLDTNHGIKVNEFLQSSVSNIYAAGDCAELDGTTWGLFTPAMAMGKLAGNNMGAAPIAFVPQTVYPARLNAFGMKIFCAGCLECESIDYSDKDNYRKVFFRNGKISGAILFNDLSKAPALQAAIENHRDRSEVEKILC